MMSQAKVMYLTAVAVAAASCHTQGTTATTPDLEPAGDASVAPDPEPTGDASVVVEYINRTRYHNMDGGSEQRLILLADGTHRHESDSGTCTGLLAEGELQRLTEMVDAAQRASRQEVYTESADNDGPNANYTEIQELRFSDGRTVTLVGYVDEPQEVTSLCSELNGLACTSP